MTSVSTTEALVKTAKKPVKKSFSESLGEVNKGWDILNELSENKFEISLKAKTRSVDVDALEKSIVQSAINDEDVIKKLEDQNKKVVGELNKEIQTIKQADIKTVHTSQGMEAIKSVADNLPESLLGSDLIFSGEVREAKPVEVIAQKSGVVSENITLNVEKPNVIKNQSNASPPVVNVLPEDKNKFFSLVMRGLAQLYISETTSIFNPVVFVFQNFRALLKTLFLLGMPALLTWLLFTKVSSLSLTMATASVPMYSFYAIMFYIASLCVCLTVLVLGIGFWAMIKKTMTDVATDANTKAKNH